MPYDWYVCQTKPNAERQVWRRFNDQNFIAYLPLLSARKAVNGRIYERKAPLFPGYVFISLDMTSEIWKPATQTRGVLHILPHSDSPRAIAAHHVEDIQRAEGEGLFKCGVVRPGEKVRMFRGTLVDQILECLESKGDRLKLLWNCLGAPRVVYARLADVTVLQ